LKHYKKRPTLLLRRLAQLAVILIVAVAAWEFAAFVEAFRQGMHGAVPHRPPVVEGFLPIAAILAFRSWISTGIIDPIHPAGFVLLTVTLATAWLFKRALCSWICPIGALSELLGWLGEKLLGRRLAGRFKGRSITLPRWLDRGLLLVKYAIFAYAFNLFFLMPLGQAVGFMRTPYYAISDVKMFEMFASLGAVGLGVIAVLAVLSIFIQSFWCRYLCPYGALLGVLGLVSPLVLLRSDRLCISCGKCDRVCPNRVGVEKGTQLVMSTECMGCTQCVSECPKEGALEFRVLGLARVKPLVIAVAFLLTFSGAIIWAKESGHWQSSLTAQHYRMLNR
jgi:polyferredoxin